MDQNISLIRFNCLGLQWHTLWAKIETSKLIKTLKFDFKVSERGLCVPWKFICKKAESGNIIIKNAVHWKFPAS